MIRYNIIVPYNVVCLYAHLYSYVCLLQENIPPLKRSIDTNDAFTPEEQHHVLKRLKTHHATSDGTLALQSANHSTVKLLPLATPHVGSSSCEQQDKTTTITNTRDGVTITVITCHIHTTTTCTGRRKTIDIPHSTQSLNVKRQRYHGGAFVIVCDC